MVNNSKTKSSFSQKGSISLSIIGLGVLLFSAIVLPLAAKLTQQRVTTQQKAAGVTISGEVDIDLTGIPSGQIKLCQYRTDAFLPGTYDTKGFSSENYKDGPGKIINNHYKVPFTITVPSSGSYDIQGMLSYFIDTSQNCSTTMAMGDHSDKITVTAPTTSPLIKHIVEAGFSGGGTPSVTATSTPRPTNTPAPATGQARVALVPSEVSVPVGGTITLDVQIQNVTGLYGAEVRLSFDPTRLQVQDSLNYRNGVQIQPGTFPNPADGFLAVNSVDNAGGTIIYRMWLLTPAEPVSGSGTFARIVFQGIAPGSASVIFTSISLLNNLNQLIPAASQNATVTVTAPASPAPVCWNSLPECGIGRDCFSRLGHFNQDNQDCFGSCVEGQEKCKDTDTGTINCCVTRQSPTATVTPRPTATSTPAPQNPTPANSCSSPNYCTSFSDCSTSGGSSGGQKNCAYGKICCLVPTATPTPPTTCSSSNVCRWFKCQDGEDDVGMLNCGTMKSCCVPVISAVPSTPPPQATQPPAPIPCNGPGQFCTNDTYCRNNSGGTPTEDYGWCSGTDQCCNTGGGGGGGACDNSGRRGEVLVQPQAISVTKGSKVIIKVTQKPYRWEMDDTCYYESIDVYVKTGPKTGVVCRAGGNTSPQSYRTMGLTAAETAAHGKIRSCEWDTTNWPAGTYVLEAYYGGHVDLDQLGQPGCCDTEDWGQADFSVNPPATPTPNCTKHVLGDALPCDGLININDFAAWRSEYLGMVPTKNADFDGDTKITLKDFGLWRKNAQ